MERWLPVAGYEGQYEVSDMGRVRGVARLTRHSHGGPERHRGKVLKPFARARKGYLYVALCKYAVHKQFSVHRLVALAFVPLDPGRLHVNHMREIVPLAEPIPWAGKQGWFEVADLHFPEEARRPSTLPLLDSTNPQTAWPFPVSAHQEVRVAP